MTATLRRIQLYVLSVMTLITNSHSAAPTRKIPITLDASITAQKGAVAFNDRQLVNGEWFLSATCKNPSRGFEGSSRLHCRLGAVKLPTNRPLLPPKSCEFDLSRIGDKDQAGYNIRPSEEFFEVKHMDDWRAIVRWSGAFKTLVYSEIYTIDMKDCSVSNVRFLENSHRISMTGNVIVFLNFFEIIVADEYRCGGVPCKIRYRVNGKQAGVPKPFQTSLNYHFTASGSFQKGSSSFFAVAFNQNHRSYEVVYVNEEAKESRLGKLPPAKFNYLTSSTAHGRYEICLMSSSSNNILCYQCVDQLEIILYRTILPRRNGTLLGMHNLKDDSLLLLTSECDIDQNSHHICKKLFATVVRKDENAVSPIFMIADHDFTCNLGSGETSVDVFEDELQYCFTLMHLSGKYSIIKDVNYEVRFRTGCLLKEYVTRSAQKSLR